MRFDSIEKMYFQVTLFSVYMCVYACVCVRVGIHVSINVCACVYMCVHVCVLVKHMTLIKMFKIIKSKNVNYNMSIT